MEDDFSIPDFLIRKDDDRKATSPVRVVVKPVIDPVLARQQELRALWAERKKAKRRTALAVHLEKHAGERWAAPKGSKTKMWIRDDKSLAAHHARLEAEFEAEAKQDEEAA